MRVDESQTLLLVSALVFGAVTLLVSALSRVLHHRRTVRRRLLETLAAGPSAAPAEARNAGWFRAAPERFGIDPAAQRRLQSELIRAGYFSPSAVGTYAAIRFALLGLLPLLGVAILSRFFAALGVTELAAATLVLLAIAYVLPGAYLARRQRRLENAYRLIFPDFLDMLVVCINAGLSLEAALDRVGRELGERDAIRANLDLMADEMRAGKSTGDALRTLSDRLGLQEARSFSALLQQTIELGTDIAQALTTFSDEMRDKRMARVEEKAAALPPKLTLPLGLFIFPVVLITVLAPAVLKIVQAVSPVP